MWVTLLDGETGEMAMKAAVGIASELAEGQPGDVPVGLLHGHALLFAYMAMLTPSAGWDDRAERWLNSAVERASDSRAVNLALFDGLCGLGWTVEHISRLFASADNHEEQDPLEDIDSLVTRCLGSRAALLPYDLISGLVGMGVYCLERLPRSDAEEGLRLILQELEVRADSTWGGKAWRTPPEQLSDTERSRTPGGYYNLGVAHGIPAVIFLLSEMVAAGVEPLRARELMGSALDWLISRTRPPQAATRFSAWFAPGVECADTRLGWCYGDLGIAAILRRVALQDGRDSVERLSNNLFDRCLDLPCERDDIADMGLCHGALGVAHIYNRLFQDTGEIVYKSTATRWYRRALSMRQPGRGVGGFFSWQPTQQPSFVDDRSVLSGAAGCALALLSASSEVNPCWDRLLLLSSRFSSSSVQP